MDIGGFNVILTEPTILDTSAFFTERLIIYNMK